MSKAGKIYSGTSISNGFDILSSSPIDNRLVVSSKSKLDVHNIYPGLRVFDISDKHLYVVESIDNTNKAKPIVNWKLIADEDILDDFRKEIYELENLTWVNQNEEDNSEVAWEDGEEDVRTYFDRLFRTEAFQTVKSCYQIPGEVRGYIENNTIVIDLTLNENKSSSSIIEWNDNDIEVENNLGCRKEINYCLMNLYKSNSYTDEITNLSNYINYPIFIKFFYRYKNTGEIQLVQIPLRVNSKGKNIKIAEIFRHWINNIIFLKKTTPDDYPIAFVDNYLNEESLENEILPEPDLIITLNDEDKSYVVNPNSINNLMIINKSINNPIVTMGTLDDDTTSKDIKILSSSESLGNFTFKINSTSYNIIPNATIDCIFNKDTQKWVISIINPNNETIMSKLESLEKELNDLKTTVETMDYGIATNDPQIKDIFTT